MSYVYEFTHQGTGDVLFSIETENEPAACHRFALSLGLPNYAAALASWGTPRVRVTAERIYDVQLVELDQAAQRMTVRLPGGTLREFAEAPAWLKPGQVGILRLPAGGGFGFQPYAEQRLRRLQAKDYPADGEDAHTVLWAWQLEGASPDERGSSKHPITTQAHFVPGKGGWFVEDCTEDVTIKMPAEFLELCESRGITPEQALQGFIADVCGLVNAVDHPREDGFSSNGSDERNMASDYFDRAYFPTDET